MGNQFWRNGVVRLQIRSSQGVGYNMGFIAMMNRGCASGGEI